MHQERGTAAALDERADRGPDRPDDQIAVPTVTPPTAQPSGLPRGWPSPRRSLRTPCRDFHRRDRGQGRGGQVANRPFYAAIGVTLAGQRDILGLWAGHRSGRFHRQAALVCRRMPATCTRTIEDAFRPLPALPSWLRRVLCVLGGYIATAGPLVVYVAGPALQWATSRRRSSPDCDWADVDRLEDLGQLHDPGPTSDGHCRLSTGSESRSRTGWPGGLIPGCPGQRARDGVHEVRIRSRRPDPGPEGPSGPLEPASPAELSSGPHGRS